MLKVAFPSFKISKFSGGEFPQNPLQVSISCACLLAPQIQNTLHRPCSHRLSLWKWPLSIRSWQLLEKVLTGCTVRQIWFDTTFKYKALNYSQARWSVPPKNTLMNLLFESWIRCQLWISDWSPHSCMHNELWIHMQGSYEISTSSVFLNLM